MKKGAILCLIPVFLLSGCGVFQYLDGSSSQEVKNLNVSKAELLKEVQDLQSGNKALRETVDLQQARIEQFEQKDKANLKAVSEGKTRIESLESEKRSLLDENQKLKEETAMKVVTLVEPQPAQKAAPVKEATLVEPQTQKKAKAPAAAKEIRIKVLAGNGGASAARKMSKALQDLGYKVERLDWTSSISVRSDTVYYAKNSEKEAKELAGRLGKDTVVKPLTWPSLFDVIVVAK